MPPADHSRDPVFASPEELLLRLAAAGYLADDDTASVAFLAERLGKPLLIEGPAGTGKTQLAKSMAEITGFPLIRLQCYEGLDESRAIYEWNYKKQLLRISAARDRSRGSEAWDELSDDIFTEEFLLERPLLAAIRAPRPSVLLIDEVDRLDVQTEALLLEVLSEFQVTIPELGTVTAATTPLIFLTSNGFRELSEALKRRCLFLYLGYPAPDREREIIRARVPALSDELAAAAVNVVNGLRRMDLKKAPSVSETLDWARSLVVRGAAGVDRREIERGLPVLLKHQADITAASDHADLGG
ncbi:MAG TPA: MoxR family ATPase [Streptosporangiaceae bacterium]